METMSLRTCCLVCEAQEVAWIFFPREGRGPLSSSLDLRVSACAVETLVHTPTSPCWAGQRSRGPGRPEFKSLSASSRTETMGMLLHSLMLSFLISIQGIVKYVDWVTIAAPDYCCKDLVSFSVTQKYQIPEVPGTTRYLRIRCLLLLLSVQTWLWNLVLLQRVLEGFGSTECRKILTVEVSSRHQIFDLEADNEGVLGLS